MNKLLVLTSICLFLICQTARSAVNANEINGEDKVIVMKKINDFRKTLEKHELDKIKYFLVGNSPNYNTILNMVSADLGYSYVRYYPREIREFSIDNNKAIVHQKVITVLFFPEKGINFFQIGECGESYMFIKEYSEWKIYWFINQTLRGIEQQAWLAQKKFEKGNIEEAIQEYENVIKEDPNYTKAYVDLSLHYNMKRDSRCLRMMQKAVEIEPGIAFYHFRLGNIYEAALNKEAADKEYGIACNLDGVLCEVVSKIKANNILR